CDGFSTGLENPVGTNPFVQCGNNAWPADLNNDTFSDGTDITIVAGSFGKAVPPAPARHNIAPDPPDGFVDGTDITQIAGFFGKTCSPCPRHSDCATVLRTSENCPNWPNSAQNLPSCSTRAIASDCDASTSA